ncbi:MAG: hypothetical protein P8123_08285, partial [bacterium]
PIPPPPECLDMQSDSLLSSATFGTDLEHIGVEAVVLLPTDGAIATFASFSSQSTSGEGVGTWDLCLDDSISSQPIQRYMSGTNDLGLVSLVNVFENQAAGFHSVRLRHATSDVLKTIVTRDVDLVAFPLATETGADFNDAVAVLGSGGEDTASASLTAISGLSTTILLDVPARVYVSSALNAASVDDAPKTGAWDIQVDGVTVGWGVSRYLSGSDDLGAVVLEGLTNELPAGIYPVTVRHATDSGILKTLNATLCAIALSDDGGGGVFIPASTKASPTAASTSSETMVDIPAGTLSLTIDVVSKIFFASSFNVLSDGGDDPRIVELDATMDGGAFTKEVDRFLSGANDIGSGGIFGLSDFLGIGSHTSILRHATHPATPTPPPPGPIQTKNITAFMMSGCTAPISPTPTPIDCDTAILDLGVKTAKGGEEIKLFGCLPAFGNRLVDVYLLAVSPNGVVYSIVYPGRVAKGLVPYIKRYFNPDRCTCDNLFAYIICENPKPGKWRVVLAALPAGAKPELKNVITFAVQTVTVSP